MIQHVEKVLTPKLTQMKDKHEQQLHEKLDSIEERTAHLDEETGINEEESKEDKTFQQLMNLYQNQEMKSIEEELKIAESKCDQDGN